MNDVAKVAAFILAIPLALALVFSVVFLEAAIFQWAWNHFATVLWAAAPRLTFWQSFAGFLLFNIITRPFKVSLGGDKKS